MVVFKGKNGTWTQKKPMRRRGKVWFKKVGGAKFWASGFVRIE